MDEDRQAFVAQCATEEVGATITRLRELVDDGQTSLAELADFSSAELDGAYAAAVGMLETNRAAKALQIAGLLVFLEPRRVDFMSLIGLALLRLEQPALAYRYYRLALDLDGDDPLTLLGCGEACLLLGDHAEAIELIEDGSTRAEGQPDLQHAVTRARKLSETYAQRG